MPPTMPDHAFDILAGPGRLVAAVARLAKEDASSLPLLGPDDCAALVADGQALALRRARPVVGGGTSAVYQDFELTMEFPPESGFRALAGAVEGLIAAALRRIDPSPLDGPFHINDMVLQRYPAGSHGITAHRDHIRYTGLVALVVLAGTGRFSICADRAGHAARAVPAPAGHLILMRAPGLFGRRDRPFHMLSEVSSERWSFGMRHDERTGS